MRWGRPLLRRQVAVLVAAGALTLGVGAPVFAATATPAGPSAGTQTATQSGNTLSPVVVGTSEVPKANDPLVKVQSAETAPVSGSADGGGSPKGYTGLVKLTGLILFLAFAWGWWAWGGELPSRADRT